MGKSSQGRLSAGIYRRAHARLPNLSEPSRPGAVQQNQRRSPRSPRQRSHSGRSGCHERGFSSHYRRRAILTLQRERLRSSGHQSLSHENRRQSGPHDRRRHYHRRYQDPFLGEGHCQYAKPVRPGSRVGRHRRPGSNLSPESTEAAHRARQSVRCSFIRPGSVPSASRVSLQRRAFFRATPLGDKPDLSERSVTASGDRSQDQRRRPNSTFLSYRSEAGKTIG